MIPLFQLIWSQRIHFWTYFVNQRSISRSNVTFKVTVYQIYWLNLKINFGYICIVIVCNTMVSTHFYILRTSVKQNWRITIMLPWAFREIQDGRHSLVKTQFWIISPIITNDTSFPANLGSRNSFLNLFWQSEVNFKVKGQVQGHCMPNSRIKLYLKINLYVRIIIVCYIFVSTYLDTRNPIMRLFCNIV